ncbi:hypothetical protein [Clostridium sp. ZS2-4]|uniref:hypothetical protein n=1 Tax=Clostridium sp. ZS2-4 TaxID=2987703 RepID=UPI00227C298F|nr:hypothetical protein [Clostridium sp. ZS2-4]MCY6354887.1 hypothetical protein [Clostridium sp. ZS2-4]
MIEVKIDNQLKEKSKDVKLGVIKYKAEVKESSEALNAELDNLCINLQEKCSIQDVLKIGSIQDIREVYKRLGKDPSRYCSGQVKL